MGLKRIGVNDGIDSGPEIEDVSYVPEELDVESSEEKSDAQRVMDGEMKGYNEDIDEVSVDPNFVWKGPKKEEPEEDDEEESEESEESEEESEETQEEEAEEEEESEEEKKTAKPAEKKKKPASAPDKVQKRINKITREKYEAKRRAEKAEKRLKELEKKLSKSEYETKKSALEGSRPKEDDFDSEEDYHVALGRWAAKLEIHDKDAPVDVDNEEESITHEDDNPVQRIIEVGRENYQDFEEVVLDDSLNITPTMVEAAADSDYASDIFYYLGQHPELAANIAKMRSPSKIAREIGQIELIFIDSDEEEVVEHAAGEEREVPPKSKKKKKKASPAPPPVKPLGGGGKKSKDPSEMTIAEYYEYRGFTRDGAKKSWVN